MSTQTFTVGFSTGITIASAITNATCAGDCDGAIDITVSGGSSSYTYAWIGPNGYTATTEDITALCHGDYQVTVTDTNGCTESEIYTVADGEDCQANVTVTDVTCYGGTDGTIQIYLSGCYAHQSGPQPTVSWTGPGGFTSTTWGPLSGLAAGTYTAAITTAAGCTLTTVVVVSEPADITAALSIGQQITCRGACDGIINMTQPTGGSGSYTITWTMSTDAGTTWGAVSATSVLSANDLQLSLACAGLYKVRVYDSNGCEKEFTITLSDGTTLLTGTAAVTPINLCGENECCGHIDFEPSPSTQAPFTYSWVGPMGYSSTTQDVNCVMEPGDYTVEVVDKDGCRFTATYPKVLLPEIGT